MTPSLNTNNLFACALAAVLLASQARADQEKPEQEKREAAHWGYAGEHGPEHWGDLDSEKNKACKVGQQQSPIDIETKGEEAAKPEDLPNITFRWSAGPVAGEVVNNGHTIQFNAPVGSSIDVGGTQYELAQFHFHAPSEHTIDGKHASMEVHFVHKTAVGKLGVVGVLMRSPVDSGDAPANAALEPIWAAMPKKSEQSVEGVKVDLGKLLPASHVYYAYEGSLTTPPCSEGVHWMVLEGSIPVSRAQVKAFNDLFHHNARPVQARNARELRLDSTP